MRGRLVVPAIAVLNALLWAAASLSSAQGPGWLAGALAVWTVASSIAMLAATAVELLLVLLRKLDWLRLIVDAAFALGWAAAFAVIWADAMQRVI